jgi:hypothetical protein
MAEPEVNPNYSQDFVAEANLRINDLEERMNTLKEKINLISKNFIDLKENNDERIEKIEKESSLIRTDISLAKKSLTSIQQESEKWVRRDEIVLIERMLKDFQPLEFIRKKDLNEIILKNQQIGEKENLEKNKKPQYNCSNKDYLNKK